MIKGIGVDMVKIERTVHKHKKLATRILTPNEYQYYQSLPEERQAEFFAGRFAIKEAYYKAKKVTNIGYHDVEIMYDEQRSPIIDEPHVFVSLTHDGDYAIAFVVIED